MMDSVPPETPKNVVYNASSESPGKNSSPGKDRRDGEGFDVLEWKNLNYTVKVVDPDNSKKYVEKQILFNVAGSLKRSRLLAVMGVSGSGKTSMLNILAGRYRDNFTGELRVEGLQLDTPIKVDHYLNNCAFIQQKDLFYATNTPEEHLAFYCRMLGVGKERLEQVIAQLNLGSCRNNLIGSEEQMIGKGISGGEMKRLSVAAELIREPKLIFADEPTSGLDSLLALDVVELLRKLCLETDCLAACTIHQPSSEIYNKFDDLCLMAEGHVVYFGDRAAATDYFKDLGYECPKFVNPADYWISICSSRPEDPESERRVKGIIDAWKQHSSKNLDTGFKNDNPNSNKDTYVLQKLSKKAELAKSANLGFMSQTKALIARLSVTLRRDPMLTKVRIGQTLFLAILLGLIYLRTKNNQEGTQNRLGATFFILVNQAMSNVIGLLQTFPVEKPVIIRETKSGLYGPGPYFVARTLLGISMETFYPLLFGAISFFLVGYDIGQPSSNVITLFLIYESILVIASLAAASLGYLVSALAPSVAVAMAAGPMTILPLMVFGGLFINSDSVPVYFLPFEAISFIKYGYHALSYRIFENIEPIECESNGPCLFQTGEDVIEYYAFDQNEFWVNIMLILVFAVVVRIMAFIALKVSLKKTK